MLLPVASWRVNLKRAVLVATCIEVALHCAATSIIETQSQHFPPSGLCFYESQNESNALSLNLINLHISWKPLNNRRIVSWKVAKLSGDVSIITNRTGTRSMVRSVSSERREISSRHCQSPQAKKSAVRYRVNGYWPASHVTDPIGQETVSLSRSKEESLYSSNNTWSWRTWTL